MARHGISSLGASITGLLLYIYRVAGCGGKWMPLTTGGKWTAWAIMLILSVIGWAIFRAPGLSWLAHAFTGDATGLGEASSAAGFVILIWTCIFTLSLSLLKDIRDLSIGDEPVMNELVFGKDRVEQILQKYLPAYAHGLTLIDGLNSAVKGKVVGSMLGITGRQVDGAVGRVFDNKNLDAAVVTRQQEAAETVTDAESHDFKASVNRSFLPHIVEMTEEAGIRLILVRVKRRRDVVEGSESAALVAYIADLRKYTARHGIPLIDFTHRPEIRMEHFGEGDHLKRPSGQRFFTESFSKRIEIVAQPGCKKSPKEIGAKYSALEIRDHIAPGRASRARRDDEGSSFAKASADKAGSAKEEQRRHRRPEQARWSLICGKLC